MKQITLIPELNWWFRIVLKNSAITDTFHCIPAELSDFWREPKSIIELLFNENFEPDSEPLPTQSLDKKYIYEYQQCNLLFIPDKKLLNRIQLYRWNALVYAASSSKFTSLFDMTGATTNLETEVQTRLPFDVDPEDRSQNITYKSRIYNTTNFPLVDTDKNLIINEPPPYPDELPAEELFGLTDDDLQFLDLLYKFKTGECVNISCYTYNTLSELAKLIYVYLSVMINDDYSMYNTNNLISSGDNILTNLYEKHVINMIYTVRSKQYGVIYNQKVIVSNRQENINVDEFMIMKKTHDRHYLTQEEVDNNEVLITENIPWDRKDFSLFKDGLLLTQDTDYTVTIDFSDVNNIVAKLSFIDQTIAVGQQIFMIWSYVVPYSISTVDE